MTDKTDTERAKFEAWAKPYFFSLAWDENAKESYSALTTDAGWMAWQAATAARSEEVRVLREALRPFANFACSPPGKCECHNCRARAALEQTK